MIPRGISNALPGFEFAMSNAMDVEMEMALFVVIIDGLVIVVMVVVICYCFGVCRVFVLYR